MGSKRHVLRVIAECRRRVVHAAIREDVPVVAATLPNLASQMRVAFASMAWNTGSSSPGELLMTCSTSEVAVCCSSASESSRVRACTSSNSRTFSIAITAWSAKVVSSSICLSVNGLTSVRCKPMAPIGMPSRRSGTPNKVLKRAIFCASPSSYSGSASTSAIWTGWPSSAVRPMSDPAPR